MNRQPAQSESEGKQSVRELGSTLIEMKNLSLPCSPRDKSQG